VLIVPLAAHHNRKAFECGEPSLDLFLQQQARQGMEKRISRTFVAVETSAPATILGYHTTLVMALKPGQVSTKLTRADIPALLLARFAIDRQWQGRQIGKALLFDVLKRAALVAELTGLYAVVLDAINDRAKSFYLRYGFRELLDDPLHLYLPVETILALGLTETGSPI
jgi:GNAT superfamily N-acetyltransferase